MIWDYLLQVTVCLALLYLPYHLWFRRETFFQFNRSYLLISLLISAVFPLLPRWLEVSEPVAVTLPAIEFTALTQVTVTAQTASSMTIPEILLIGYFVVAAVLLCRLLADILSILRMLHTGEKRKHRGVTLVVHPDASAPFSFFNAVFVGPAILEDTRLFRHVLDHEMQHVRGRHSFDVLLIEVLCALLWISPLVYLYRRAMKNVHEYLADTIILADERIDYAETLISQAHSGLRLALTNQFFQSQLKSRITMMMKEPSQRMNKWKYLLALPVLMLSVALFSFRNSVDPGTAITPTTVQDTVPQEIFKVVEEMPRFPGCEDEALSMEDRYTCAQKKMLEYVYSNLKYPEAARKAGLEGRVVGQFVVEGDGSIASVRIVRDIGHGCGDEVVRVLESMNTLGEKWTPGRQRGKAVRVQYTIPVSFKLGPAPKESKAEPKAADAGAREIFKVVEQMPRFPGCEEIDGSDQDKYQCSLQKLMSYVFENLQYPAEAKTKGIEGRSIAQFVVEPNGLISSIKVVRELGHGCDVEVIRILESMNEMPERWIPGRQRGKPVAVQLTLPVSFKL